MLFCLSCYRTNSGSLAYSSTIISQVARRLSCSAWLRSSQQLVWSCGVVLFLKELPPSAIFYFFSKGHLFIPSPTPPGLFLVALISCIHKCQQVSFVIVTSATATPGDGRQKQRSCASIHVYTWAILFLLLPQYVHYIPKGRQLSVMAFAYGKVFFLVIFPLLSCV